MTEDRFAERRRVVAEDRARRSLRRMLVLLTAAGAVAGLVYLVNSPALSVDTIAMSGVSNSGTPAALAANGIVEGAPLAWLDIDEAREAISSDPWVEEVAISRDWPTTVVVEVTERAPLATIGGDVVALDGVVLPGATGEGLATLGLTAEAEDGVYRQAEVVGALRFVGALRPDLRPGVSIVSEPDGLVASVAGYRVRLGRPVDMEQKARALAPIIDDTPPEGSEITVIAPTRPAVLDPVATPTDSTTTTTGAG